MGNGVSTNSPAHLFAYRAIKEEYERLKLVIQLEELQITDEHIYNILTNGYEISLHDYEIPLTACKSCISIAMKYVDFTKEEKIEYDNLLMETINTKEKKLKYIAAKKAAESGNYDKSTGGTALDTKK